MENKKYKILFIMHMPPPVHGAAMVGKYIHDSEIINKTFDCYYFNLALSKVLEDIGKGGIKKFSKFIKQLWDIAKIVRQTQPEICYTTPNACGGAFYKDFIVIMLLKMMKQNIIIHFHNKGVSTRQDKFIDNLLYKRFFKNIKVILLTENLYDDVKKYVKKENIFICPNGIPETLIEEPLAIRNNKIPHLLFLSNLIISKGILVLLDACKILKEKGYSFVCNFIGGETQEMSAKQFQQEIIKRGLTNEVIYNGKKYGKEKCIFFKQADIFVFPTYYYNETFGLVNLEAMEYKLPIVTTDEGGIKDIVKDKENGFISQKNNPDSLATCIEQLLNNKELRYKMGENGYKKFKEQFTLLKFENQIKKILIECCNQNKTNSNKL